MAKIAVIGWGSLLWDLDDLEPHVEGAWQVAQGPMLPLEFVRVSKKRNMALAVVIDHDHGVPCASSHILSRRGDVQDAVVDLARRERAPEDQIGYVDTSSGGDTKPPRFGSQTAFWNGWTGPTTTRRYGPTSPETTKTCSAMHSRSRPPSTT